MTTLKPFFTFYGGKWRSAKRLYPAPKYDTIIEPFAGSAGYSLRYPERRVRLFDTDPVIYGVWNYLINVPASEVLALPDLNEGQSVDDLNLPQEAKWLIGFWLNKGVSRPCKTPSKWMRLGTHSTSFWGPEIRERIASQIQVIRHWRVFNVGYTYALAPKSELVTWFIDPPYEGAGQHYVHGASGIDYADLAKWCKTRSGQVIVCENIGAQWLPFQPLGRLKATSYGGGRVSEEVIWTQEDE